MNKESLAFINFYSTVIFPNNVVYVCLCISFSTEVISSPPLVCVNGTQGLSQFKLALYHYHANPNTLKTGIAVITLRECKSQRLQKVESYKV